MKEKKGSRKSVSFYLNHRVPTSVTLLGHGSSGSRPTPCRETQTLLPCGKNGTRYASKGKIISCSLSCSKCTWCRTTFLNNTKYLLQILHSLIQYQISWDYSKTVLRLVYLKCTEYIFIFIRRCILVNTIIHVLWLRHFYGTFLRIFGTFFISSAFSTNIVLICSILFSYF